jgi:hypothetical protein
MKIALNPRRWTACALVVTALTGCASDELQRRLAVAEKSIRAMDRTDANFEQALNVLLTSNQRYEEQMRRIETLLSRQHQTGAEQDRAVREALALAQESASVTRRLEIRRLGESFLLVVKP